MVQQMALKTAKRMSEHSIINAKEILIYAYGLELLFSSIAGVVALIVISVVYGKPYLWIPYLAGFVPLRLSGGGYHAKTHFQCISAFSLLYSLTVLIEMSYKISLSVWLVAGLINLIILLFSPVVAPNEPLKQGQGKTNRWNSVFLGLLNLLGCVLLCFLLAHNSQWVNMYFAGSSMAGLSMLLDVIKKGVFLNGFISKQIFKANKKSFAISLCSGDNALPRRLQYKEYGENHFIR